MSAGGPAKPFVLFTNLWLGGRSGTVVVTRDYAVGLAERGWRVAIYTPNDVLGAPDLVPRVEVLRSLDEIIDPPDLIHGHQHPVLVAALARFPGVPAIQIIHDAVGWHDRPVRFERVRAYAAVDAACHDRAVSEAGVEAGAVARLPNALDLSRCKPRGPLPERPRRVLVVANRDGAHVPAVEAACRAAGLEVASVGWGVSRGADQLEAIMGEADIVVGCARIALEAMAVGCAVLVCDHRGLAGIAYSADFDRWRGENFGLRLLTQPVTEAAVGAALATYDAQGAGEIQRRVRAECGLEPALDRLEALYRRTMETHAAAPRVDADREARDLGGYLQAWLPSVIEQDPFRPAFERERNAARLAQAKLDSMVELARQGIKIQFQAGERPPG